MLSYSQTTIMRFLTKEWCGFDTYTVNLFFGLRTKRINNHITGSIASLRWYAFLCFFALMCSLTKEWYGFDAYTANLFLEHIIRLCTKRINNHNHITACVLEMVCFFGSDMLFTSDYLSISFFCQSAYYDWLTKDNISHWFLVI